MTDRVHARTGLPICEFGCFHTPDKPCDCECHASSNRVQGHGFTFVHDAYGREWARCSCGWTSPDIIGIDAAREQHRKHADAIPNRVQYDEAIFDDDVCRSSKGHCGRLGCCEGEPPSEHLRSVVGKIEVRPRHATRNRAAEIIAAELRRHLCFTHPDTARRQADAVVKRLHEAGIDV